MKMNHDYSQRLKEVLFLLASPANIQIKAFPEFVHIPDEIVSETSDAIDVSPTKISDQDSGILLTLKKIDDIFDKMGGSQNNWTIESIKTNDSWQHIRKLAQQEIDRQKLNYKTPDLFWLTYFRSNA